MLFRPVYLPHIRRHIMRPSLLAGGERATDILKLMLRKKYDALHNIFHNTSEEEFIRINKNYRNEVETLLASEQKDLFTHHSAGDKFCDTLKNMKEYFILDDVVGFNNLLTIHDNTPRPLSYKLNVPPYFRMENGKYYVLVALIDKRYNFQAIRYDTYTYPLIVPQYNKDKKSFPLYLHALYRRHNLDSIRPLQYPNEYTKYIEKYCQNVSPSMYVEPIYRAYPHWGAACVFNTFMALMRLCGKEFIDACSDDPLLQRVLIDKDLNEDTRELERKYIQEDISLPCDVKAVLSFPLLKHIDTWEFTQKYNDVDSITSLKERVSSDSCTLIGAALCVSRIGNWNNFFHNIAYSSNGYIIDDMTYNPKPVSIQEIDDITLAINYAVVKKN